MKKVILVFLLIEIVSMNFETMAQDIGFRGGYQSSGTWNDGDQVDGDLPGFYVGIFKNSRIGLGDLLMINYGLEYIQNGHKSDDSNYRSIDYLSIPLALRVKLGPVYAQGGINGNFRIGEEYLLNGSDVLNDNNKTSGFDVPAHIGLGFKILMISIEARYHYGLMDVNNGNANRYFQIGAGISF
ncbi:outer membrane beta-barrel protein [Shivajiella indica]|uniref:Outer membrane beta-barrel protein n=1 Tax=Shivajiella indica TaxID=872115 RepID=A0ABW5BF04_9BACT